MKRRAGGGPQEEALAVKESAGIVIITDDGRELELGLPGVTLATRMSIGEELWIVTFTF